MDAAIFADHARKNPEMEAFLRGVCAECHPVTDETQLERYFTVTGTEVLFALAAFALYRWLKDYFDFRRAIKETEIIQAQAEIIRGLIRDGANPRQAEEITKALLKQLKKRNQGDPILISAAKLLEE